MQMNITYTKGHETKKANYAKTNTIHETNNTYTTYITMQYAYSTNNTNTCTTYNIFKNN